MKVKHIRNDMGGPGLAAGYLEVEVDGETYLTATEQKPIFYGSDLLVFAEGNPGKTVGKNTEPEGSYSEDPAEGAVPAYDVDYELSTRDPVLVAIARDWYAGKLPVGEVDLANYQEVTS